MGLITLNQIFVTLNLKVLQQKIFRINTFVTFIRGTNNFGLNGFNNSQPKFKIL